MAYNIKNCVYLIRCPEHAKGLVKIGLTTDLDSRMNSLNGATETPVPFKVIAVVETDKYQQLEAHLHHIYSAERVNPRREFFKFVDEDGTEYVEDAIDMMRECAELVGGTFHLMEEEEEDAPREKMKRFAFKNIGLKGGDEVVLDIPGNDNTPQTYYVAANGIHVVEKIEDVNNKEAWHSVSSLMQEYLHTRQWASHPEWWYHNGVCCASNNS